MPGHETTYTGTLAVQPAGRGLVLTVEGGRRLPVQDWVQDALRAVGVIQDSDRWLGVERTTEPVTLTVSVDLPGDEASGRRVGGDRVRTQDTALWGPAPSGNQVDAAQGAGDQVRASTLALVLEGSLDVGRAAHLLKLNYAVALKRINDGELFAIKHGGRWHLPRWQIRGDRPLIGLTDVLQAWPGSRLSLAVWAVTPNADLGGQSPARALADGRLSRVLEAERAISSAAW